MTTKHTHRLPVLLTVAGEESEIEVYLNFSITRARPATPPSYASGGDPPEPAQIEILSGTVVGDGAQLPDWLIAILQENEGVHQTLGDAADWGEPQRDPDDERDRRRDDALTQVQP
jgi:hypothetical protein